MIWSMIALVYCSSVWFVMFILLVSLSPDTNSEAYQYVFIDQQWMLPFFFCTGLLSLIIYLILRVVTVKDVKNISNRAQQCNNMSHSRHVNISNICDEQLMEQTAEAKAILEHKKTELVALVNYKLEQANLKEQTKELAKKVNENILKEVVNNESA